MCVIIHRKQGTKAIDKKDLEKIIQKNPHGWGVSYFDKGRIKVVKSMDMTRALPVFQRLESENKELLFHVRWATKGGKNKENCHPFKVHRGVMFHNGTFDMKLNNKKKSDSWHFTFLFNPLHKRGIEMDAIIKNELENIVDDNRLAFMMQDGTVSKYGKWHEKDGLFFSNNRWENTYAYTGGYGWEDYEEYIRPYGGHKSYPSRNYSGNVNTIRKSNIDNFSRIRRDARNGILRLVDVLFLPINEMTELMLDFPEITAKLFRGKINLRAKEEEKI